MSATKSLLCALSLLTGASASADLASVQACIAEKYGTLKHRNGIVAAVVGAKDARVMTFGRATVDQIFEIGSVTKTFTGTLLAQAVLEGRKKLSDPIPAEFQKSAEPITYRHLTTHTSGIFCCKFPEFDSGNPESPWEGLTRKIFRELYAKTPLTTPPGTRWEYSNIATGLLGQLLEDSAGVSYEALLAKRIFHVLGMTDSYTAVPASEAHRFPKGYVTDGNDIVPFSHWNVHGTAVSSAGSIRSTISDMVKYARANLVPESTPLGAAISLAHQPLYERRKGKWMGMNWIVEPEEQIVWHNGSTVAFNSILLISHKLGVAIVAMTDTGVFKEEGSEIVADNALEDIAWDCLQ